MLCSKSGQAKQETQVCFVCQGHFSAYFFSNSPLEDVKMPIKCDNKVTNTSQLYGTSDYIVMHEFTTRIHKNIL